MRVRKITERVSQTLTPYEAYTLTGILYYSDFKTNTSKVREEKIADLLGISRQSISKHLKKLTSNNIIKIDKVDLGGYKLANYYTTNIDNYKEIDIEKLLKLDTTPTIKGFLVLLKTACFNATNTIMYRTYDEFAENMNISRMSIIKYLKEAISKGFIKKNKKGRFVLVDEEIFRVEPIRTDEERMKRYYKEAYDEDDFDSNGNFINKRF